MVAEQVRGRGPERRRGEVLLRAVHEAVLAEVAEVGLGQLTMEGIARRAATAKTSLYRRWSNPQDLLLDALHDAHPVEEPSPSGDDLRADLITALTLLVEWLTSPAANAVKAIMTERRRYPDLAEALYERVFDPRGGTFTHTVLRHYAEQGTIDSRLLTPIVFQIGEALVFKLLVDLDRFPTHDELAAIVDQAILPAVGVPRDAATVAEA
ncbi:TetR/AcrR family transcriptional regulator [Micromonospora sp. KC606]|uniref:TetR/AcrR family transcriptional regulator n=1 Tax=Micromonospora sp. KC606 TaxID=2530379 RepID=UPI001FB5B9CA|nr:TetR/AcrR family transcriptional regulator [Micromonospora sp. KC606]